MYSRIAKTPRVYISPNVVSTLLSPTNVVLRVYSSRSSTTNDSRPTFMIYDSTNPFEYSVRVTTLYYIRFSESRISSPPRSIHKRTLKSIDTTEKSSKCYGTASTNTRTTGTDIQPRSRTRITVMYTAQLTRHRSTCFCHDRHPNSRYIIPLNYLVRNGMRGRPDTDPQMSCRRRCAYEAFLTRWTSSIYTPRTKKS